MKKKHSVYTSTTTGGYKLVKYHIIKTIRAPLYIGGVRMGEVDVPLK